MKRMKTIALLLALVGVQAGAQNLKVWVNDVAVKADGTTVTTVTVCQTDPTDDQYVGFQMKMNVPEGIHIAQKKSGRVYVDDLTLNANRFEGLGHSLSGNMPDATTIVLSCVDMSNAPFYPDDADGNTVEELFTIGLVAENAAINGEYTVTLSGVDFIHSNGSSNSPTEDVSFRLTITDGQEPVNYSITYNLNAPGLGTLILPFDAALPEGMSAYRCMALKETSVVLESMDRIPAATPLLVLGTPDTYQFKGVGTAIRTSYTSGLLTGVLQAENITSGYVLQTKNGVAGFYHVADAITVPANRCYLNVDASVKTLTLDFPEGNGIFDVQDAMAKDQNGDVMYDLQGRRIVTSSQRGKTGAGVYIENGKKVIIK